MSNFKLVAFPLPSDMTLNRVTKKAGNTKGTVAHLRSLTTPFTVIEGDEQTTTKAKGNSGHNIDLTAPQFAEAERVIAPLRTVATKGTKATKAEKEAAEAIVAELTANGGIRLPVNRRGRNPGEGESIGSLFEALNG